MGFFGLDIPALHDEALGLWYRRDGESEPPLTAHASAAGVTGDDLQALVLRQHFANYSIWRLEDQARRRDVGDNVIAAIKRAIDPWNQRRNDLMESIDLALLAELGAGDAGGGTGRGQMHSETAAMMVDRLSILSLKLRNMNAAAARAVDASDHVLAEECRSNGRILQEQRADLATCLTALIEDFRAGRRHFKMYRQMKAYNDPRLNPALRGSGRDAADAATAHKESTKSR